MRRPFLLLTTVVLAALAIGLFLAMVGKVRHSANRATCQNNLKLLSLGLLNYRESTGHFPAATVRNPDLPPERRLSWLFEIDPYVHARMDPTWTQYRNEAWDSEGNLQLQRGRMPWYECPRRTEKSRPDGIGFTSYVGATGVGSDAAELLKPEGRAGVFGYDRQTSRDEITDGLSNTLMVIETDRETGPWVAGGQPTARGLDQDTRPYVGSERPFGGLHRGGVLAVMADGTVRFIRDTVSPDVLEALFTIAGGGAHESPWDD